MASNRKKEYDIKYIKEHYKRIVLNCKPEIVADFDRLAAASGLSRSAAIVAAVRYCLENNIDIGAARGADP